MEDGFVLVDCFGSSPTSCFVSVFDGHGGREVVDFVNVHLPAMLLAELQSVPIAQQREPQAISDAITRSYCQVDNAIWASGIQQSGCTAVSCLLTETSPGCRTIFTAHLGDARAVRSECVASALPQLHRWFLDNETVQVVLQGYLRDFKCMRGIVVSTSRTRCALIHFDLRKVGCNIVNSFRR